MTRPRTLKAIRQGASSRDRNDPALAPSTAPQWAVARDGTRYVTCRLNPLTLNELRKYSREFGRAAARDAEWACVTVWLMNGPADADLTNPAQVASLSVQLVKEAEAGRFGWPTADGEERSRPALDFLSPEAREEAERTAAETLSDWRRAGRPHLGPDRLKRTYQYLITCPAFRKYVRPLADNEN